MALIKVLIFHAPFIAFKKSPVFSVTLESMKSNPERPTRGLQKGIKGVNNRDSNRTDQKRSLKPSGAQ